MASATDIVRRALKLIGVLAAGETPSPESQADGLTELNVLLDSWANERRFIFGTRRAAYTLVPNLSPHTLGEGGTFPYVFPFGLGGGGAIDAPRPLQLPTGMGIIRVGQTLEAPLKILTDAEYQLVGDKTLTEQVPRWVWIEQTFPLANLWFWPVPTTAATVVLYTLSRIATLAAQDQISLPAGYENALAHALGLQVAPSYGVQPSQTFLDNAAEAIASIQRTNAPDLKAELDGGIQQRRPYNIYTDGLW
jgi:hypothetical protein